eukprot:14372165-Alexandrium_andersonii.AAC.1
MRDSVRALALGRVWQCSSACAHALTPSCRLRDSARALAPGRVLPVRDFARAPVSYTHLRAHETSAHL